MLTFWRQFVKGLLANIGGDHDFHGSYYSEIFSKTLDNIITETAEGGNILNAKYTQNV